MQKRTKAAFIVVPLLTITMASVVWVSFGDCPGQFRRSFHRIVLGNKDFIGKQVRFRLRVQGTLLLPNGRLAGFTTLRSSDCVNVIVQAEDRGSPEQAEEEMEKRIRGASKVVEEVPLFDPHGEPIGQRAILMVVQEEPRVEIIAQHKKDSKLFVIRSTSLANALAYEKLVQNGYTIDRDGYFVAQSKQPGAQ